MNSTYNLCHICIPISDKQENHLLTKIQVLKNYYKSFKPIDSKTFHITLFFIGTLNSAQINKINEELKILIQDNADLFSKLTINIKSVSYFNNKHSIVLFAVVNNTNTLIQINKLLSYKFSRYNTEKQPRFIPHLTLGRLYNKLDRQKFKGEFEQLILPVFNDLDLTFNPEKIILRGRNSTNNELTDLQVFDLIL